MPDRMKLSSAHINALAKGLSVPLSLILPIVILYILDPNSFQFAWKGRFPYLFFLWLFFLELALARRKLPENTLGMSKRTKTLAAAIAMAVPTVYAIATVLFGLNQEIAKLGKSVEVPYKVYGEWFIQVSWPLSFEYLLFTAIFTVSILLTYGIKGLKRFPTSLFFLGATGLFYMIDTFYPYGTFIALQRLVPLSASSATGVLNWMGYETRLFHYGFTRYVDDRTIEEVVTIIRIGGGERQLQFTVNWPSAGVHNLLIYTLIILLFLKNVPLSPQRKTIQAAIPKRLKFVARSKRISFLLERKIIHATVMAAKTFIIKAFGTVPIFIVVVIGAVGTFIVNVLRIVTICIIAVNADPEATQMFHNYYGELFFVVWVITYLLAIIYCPKIFTKLLQPAPEAQQYPKVSSKYKAHG